MPTVASGLGAGSFNLAPTTAKSGGVISNSFAAGTTLANSYGAARSNAAFGDALAPTLLLNTSTNVFVGQDGATDGENGGFTCNVYELFLEFDTATQAGKSITAATLSVNVASDKSTTDFTLRATGLNYTAPVSTSAFVVGSSLSASPLATLATSSLTGVGNYTLTGSVLSAINNGSGSKTRVILYSSRTEANNVPSDGVLEYVNIAVAYCRLNVTVA
jgi:hypothetical protein